MITLLKEELEELRYLYFLEFGIQISDDETTELANSLLILGTIARDIVIREETEKK